jgi:hypothetical protein
MAVASLVLGMCGVLPFVGWVTGLIAVILGIIVLATKRRGNALAVGGIAAGVVLTALVMIWLPMARQDARRVVSRTNLRGIGIAVGMYASDYNECLPPDLSVLVRDSYVSTGQLSSPATGNAPPRMIGGKLVGPVDYVYVRPAEKVTDLDSPFTAIVAYEPPKHWDGKGTFVLYMDGHTEWLSAEEFQAARAGIREWQPPPDR